MHVKAQDESEPKARRLQMIMGETHGGIIGGSAGTVVHHYVGGSSAGGIVGGDIGTGGTVVHHYVDGSSAGGVVGGDIGTGGTVVHHYVDGSSGSGIVGGGHYVGSSIGGVIPATHYVGGTSSVGGIIHGGVQDHVHVTHYTVPAPVPQPVTPQVKVKQVVQNHYGTVYRTSKSKNVFFCFCLFACSRNKSRHKTVATFCKSLLYHCTTSSSIACGMMLNEGRIGRRIRYR